MQSHRDFDTLLMALSFQKIVWKFLMKLNIYFPHNPAVPLLDIYPREMNTYIYMKTCAKIFKQNYL